LDITARSHRTVWERSLDGGHVARCQAADDEIVQCRHPLIGEVVWQVAQCGVQVGEHRGELGRIWQLGGVVVDVLPECDVETVGAVHRRIYGRDDRGTAVGERACHRELARQPLVVAVTQDRGEDRDLRGDR
jgi:hypothetical protein